VELREQDREQDDLPNGDPRKPKLTWDWQDVEIEETEDLKMEPPDGDPPSAEWVKTSGHGWPS
jgi:hypothetical protein